MDSVVDEYYISLCGGAQLGQIQKIRQKVIQKNSWNCRIILVYPTISQILNVKRSQPETEIM